MLDVLDVFGIREDAILDNKAKLATCLGLDNIDNREAIISTVLSLIKVVHSMQKYLKHNEIKNNRELQDAIKEGAYFEDQDQGLAVAEDENSEYDSDSDDSSYEEELDTYFDTASRNSIDQTHSIPTNFTYSYKPKQSTTLKLPANINNDEKSGKNLEFINWMDYSPNQMAIKYNISKSIIGPAIRILRDFEKQNNKLLLEKIESRRKKLNAVTIATISSNVNCDNSFIDKNVIPAATIATLTDKDLKKKEDAKDLINIKLTEDGKNSNNSKNTKELKDVAVSRSSHIKKSIIPHKAHLRLRKRRPQKNSINQDEDSSSESVSDPNNESDAGENEVDNTSSELALSVNKQHERSAEPDNIIKKRKLDADNNSININNKEEEEAEAYVTDHSQSKKKAKNDQALELAHHKHINNQEHDNRISDSLYSFLQSSNINTDDDKLVECVRTNSKLKKDSNIGLNSNGGVSAFAYSSTDNGHYKCESEGCKIAPFSQYIQLYKHKKIIHPEELH